MRKLTIAVSLFMITLPLGAAAAADKKISASLHGYQETPSISTVGSGEFRATINGDETEIGWELSYANLEATVTQAHIHFGQVGVAGGITVFLCTNLGNSPAGTQACPPPPTTITGTIRAADVSPPITATAGARAQGLGTGEFAELLKAIRAGVTYANVHSETFPSGEIRGQIDDHPGGN